jgi:hypothetical protein
VLHAITVKLTEQANYVVWRDSLPAPAGPGRGKKKGIVVRRRLLPGKGGKITGLKSNLPDADPGDVTAHRWRKRIACITDRQGQSYVENRRQRAQRGDGVVFWAQGPMRTPTRIRHAKPLCDLRTRFTTRFSADLSDASPRRTRALAPVPLRLSQFCDKNPAGTARGRDAVALATGASVASAVRVALAEERGQCPRPAHGKADRGRSPFLLHLPHV